MDVVKLVEPVCQFFRDLLKFGVNGCQSTCCHGLCACSNPEVQEDAEDYKQTREHLDGLRQEIEAAIDRCQRKL